MDPIDIRTERASSPAWTLSKPLRASTVAASRMWNPINMAGLNIGLPPPSASGFAWKERSFHAYLSTGWG
ncbi:hypothetical protein GCM10012319_37120 [Comamonas sp. KCTC 72670]|nr:hypothetical protein GCM10012319_37120 [Comamonas sp. KCTC 72670]